MKARRRGRDPEESRERILRVAIELFSQRGYAGSGVDEVASRAGIAKTALYYHFGNKEGLLAAVLERLAVEWIDHIEAVSLEARDPIERMDRALARMRAMIEEQPWVLKLFQLTVLEVAPQKPEVREILLRVGARARQAIAHGLESALHTEVPDADGAAQVVIGMLMSISLGHELDPGQVDLDQAFAELRRMTILTVAARLEPSLIANLEAAVRGA